MKEVVIDGVTYVPKEQVEDDDNIYFTLLAGYDKVDDDSMTFFTKEEFYEDEKTLISEDSAVAVYKDHFGLLYFKYKVNDDE